MRAFVTSKFLKLPERTFSMKTILDVVSRVTDGKLSGILMVIMIIVAVVLVKAVIVTILWNALLPTLGNFPTLSLWQGFLLSALISALWPGNTFSRTS